MEKDYVWMVIRPFGGYDIMYSNVEYIMLHLKLHNVIKAEH